LTRPRTSGREERMKTARFIVAKKMQYKGVEYGPGDILETHPANGKVLQEKELVKPAGEKAVKIVPERSVAKNVRAIKGLNHARYL
jgi:hypothetical protein